MWVLTKMVSLQMWKYHRRISFKRIPSRTTIHMHARSTSKVWKYFAVLISAEDRRNNITKKEVWKSKRKTHGHGKYL